MTCTSLGNPYGESWRSACNPTASCIVESLAGCSTTPAPLQNMVLALQNSLITAGFNPDRADRPFTPHLTLLRKVPVISQPGNAEPLPEISPLPWHCSRWVLVRSRANAQGGNSQAIGEFLLA